MEYIQLLKGLIFVMLFCNGISHCSPYCIILNLVFNLLSFTAVKVLLTQVSPFLSFQTSARSDDVNGKYIVSRLFVSLVPLVE